MHGGDQDQKLACEDPEWRGADDGKTAAQEYPAQHRIAIHDPCDVIHVLGASGLRHLAACKKYRRLCKRMRGHMQKRGEGREWTAQSERERGKTHMLDRGVRKQALHVTLAAQRKGADYD